eukprot:2598226-Alexandrium_andersonii.AAC.1
MPLRPAAIPRSCRRAAGRAPWCSEGVGAWDGVVGFDAPGGPVVVPARGSARALRCVWCVRARVFLLASL